MRAGSLDRLITIQRRTTGLDLYGTPIETWATFATVRAQLLQNQTSDTEAGPGHRTDIALGFRIRFVDGVDLDMRVSYEGNAYTIRKISEIGRRVGLDLTCERVGP